MRAARLDIKYLGCSRRHYNCGQNLRHVNASRGKEAIPEQESVTVLSPVLELRFGSFPKLRS